jgi:hypothetical protein
MSDDAPWERSLEARRDAPPDLVGVTFDLPPDRRPMRTESMWAERVGPDPAR